MTPAQRAKAALKRVECYYEERQPYWSGEAVMSEYGDTIREALEQMADEGVVTEKMIEAGMRAQRCRLIQK